ncbi:MAG: hypothetical protein GWN00_18725 [Aliifodinibius sp.]|nr:response regulator transcription factor [Fodinibius sp.]NIV13101.1 hypothetical protein [Fodinibius sp.]NIY26766.1 hypothetical protein [Fodinibius sp.]
MHILLVGNASSITTTIKTMLQSIDNSSVRHSDLARLKKSEQLSAEYDLIVANIEDFDRPSTKIVSEINKQFPDTPLLVVHSYLKKTLITPMIKAGATGYIQNNVSETQLIEAVQKVASGTKCIIAETT